MYNQNNEEYPAQAYRRALYGEHGLWVRPAAMFDEEVVVDGVAQPRFVRIESEKGHESLFGGIA